MDLLDKAKAAFNFTKNTIAGGVSQLAETAADTAADAALAPLTLIENQLKSISKLGPEIVANRRNAINAMLTGIEADALRYNKEAAANARMKAIRTIGRRIEEVMSDSSVPDTIKTLYTDIVKNSDENTTAEDFLDALANADDSLSAFEEKDFNIMRLINRAWRISSDYIYRILFLFAMVFGGTILSNAYVHEDFWAIRFYYFCYGTIFFPLALIYGVVNPPAWNATIFPMYKAIPKEVTSVEIPIQAPVSPIQAYTNPQLGGAVPLASGPGPFATGPTLTERFNLIVMSLFGYTYETDTMSIRVLSAVLAGSLSTWAYYRGDLNQVFYYANKWTEKKVTTTAKPK